MKSTLWKMAGRVPVQCAKALAQGLLLLVVATCVSACAMLGPLTTGYHGLNIEEVHRTIIVAHPAGSNRIYPYIRHVADDRILVDGGTHTVSRRPQMISHDGGFTWNRFNSPDDVFVKYARSVRFTNDIYYHHSFFHASRLLVDCKRDCSGAWSEGGEVLDRISNIEIAVPNQIRPEYRPIMIIQNAIFSPDSHLLLFAHTHFEEDPPDETRRYRNHRRTIVLRSVDRGQTFEYLSTIATHRDSPWGVEGPNEPSGIFLQSGELFAVMRTGSDPRHRRRAFDMLSARSFDNGKTWEDHRRIPREGVWPQVIQLTNGVLVCTAGRPFNHLIFSVDNGRTWTTKYTLDRRHRSSGYIDIREIEPNRILVVYEADGFRERRFWLWEPPPEKNVAKAVILDVVR